MSDLPEGPARPNAAALDRFWQSARGILPSSASGDGYQVRWIGLDHDSTEQVLSRAGSLAAG